MQFLVRILPNRSHAMWHSFLCLMLNEGNNIWATVMPTTILIYYWHRKTMWVRDTQNILSATMCEDSWLTCNCYLVLALSKSLHHAIDTGSCYWTALHVKAWLTAVKRPSGTRDYRLVLCGCLWVLALSYVFFHTDLDNTPVLLACVHTKRQCNIKCFTCHICHIIICVKNIYVS